MLPENMILLRRTIMTGEFISHFIDILLITVNTKTSPFQNAKHRHVPRPDHKSDSCQMYPTYEMSRPTGLQAMNMPNFCICLTFANRKRLNSREEKKKLVLLHINFQSSLWKASAQVSCLTPSMPNCTNYTTPSISDIFPPLEGLQNHRMVKNE